MKIDNFDLQMFSDHYKEKVQLNEELEVVEPEASPPTEPAPLLTSIKLFSEEEVRFHKAVISEVLFRLTDPTGSEENREEKRISLYRESSETDKKGELLDSAQLGDLFQNRLGRIRRISRSFEQEVVEFSTKGRVHATDRTLNVDIDFRISRNILSDQQIIRRFQVKDPLVINYNTTLASLSEKKFRFDIDSDGLSDQVSLLKKGSGFLALDRNNDGKVNNGSELFGTKSGNGFKDLMIYDTDGNGWIDENDPIFDKLRVWVKNDSGEDRLIGLGEVGIGAIYLGNVETPFTLTDSENEERLGILKQSGIFLKENGEAGIVQNIELAVEAAEPEAPQYKSMDENAFRKDYSEYEVKTEEERETPFAAPGKEEAAGQSDDAQADLLRQLRQLESRLKHSIGTDEHKKLLARIDLLKAKLSVSEGYEIQRLFNTLG